MELAQLDLENYVWTIALVTSIKKVQRMMSCLCYKSIQTFSLSSCMLVSFYSHIQEGGKATLDEIELN